MLIDPIIEIRSKDNQINDIYDNIKNQITKNERTLILTTTKKHAEELSLYLKENKIKAAYIHDRSFFFLELNNLIIEKAVSSKLSISLLLFFDNFLSTCFI